GLTAEDLEAFGSALWWSGKPDESAAALERAFGSYMEAGKRPEAAWAAMTLAYQAFRANTADVGGGWLAQVERILADEPEGKMHARFGVFRALYPMQMGRFDEGIALADQAIELGRKYDEPSAMYQAMSFKGLGEMFTGRWQAGLADIDESAAAALTGR